MQPQNFLPAFVPVFALRSAIGLPLAGQAGDGKLKALLSDVKGVVGEVARGISILFAWKAFAIPHLPVGQALVILALPVCPANIFRLSSLLTRGEL